MKRVFLCLIPAIICLLSLKQVDAQNTDPVMLNVADEEITKSEFLKVYMKNNTKTDAFDRQSLEEYLDLYINFRLKVKEAMVLGMDTIKSFRDELSSYRKQLAQPYLTDEKAIEELCQEAYNHKQKDVRASHILINCDKYASSADTLAAWNKLMDLRKKILKGEDFGKLARENSDDPSAKDRKQDGRSFNGNSGDLGYFTAFDMVYPFEKTVYNLKVGEVSMPIRTDYGFHLIKLTDMLPAMGKVQLAHIILTYPKNATVDDSLKVADSANLAYEMLRNGSDFATVVKKFSDDRNTADKGGVLPWYGVNRLLPEFIQNINTLPKTGDYSEPFQTPFGWHIIMMKDRKPVGSYEDEKEEIKQKVNKNDRISRAQESFVTKVKREYGFTEDLSAVNDFSKVVTDSIFSATWKAKEAESLTRPLFTIGTRTYYQQDFTKNLAASQRKGQKKDIPAYIQFQYRSFVNETVQKYADNQLEIKYPDFKSLMSEYHDGILLFDLTDKKVWSKAVKDTVGLQKFYEVNRNNYMWDKRLEVAFFTIKDNAVVKSLKKLIKKGLSDQEILARINQDTIQKVTVEHRKFIRGENAQVDSLEWKAGTIGPFATKEGKTLVAVIHRIVDPEPKLLNEARGLITADYQNYLEKDWIAELRKKYPVTVYREVFESLIEKK
jgi:peptidyl-prolyl cis-trans isomerase SurA